MHSTTQPGHGAAIGRKLLLALIAVLAAWAFLVALSGGFDLRPYGIAFRSTAVSRPAIAAALLAIVYAVAFHREAQNDLVAFGARVRSVARLLDARASAVSAVLAVLVFVIGMTHGTHVAGGSDSYGYISQADLWLARDLVIEQPIATQVPWPEAHWTFAPLAYRPALEPGAIVPVYPPGLSVVMAAGKLIVGACGPYLVVPLFGALMVWLTFRLGAQVWSPLAGVLGAALMASSPAFLFMLMNPMSDVPVSAAWLLAIVTALSPSRWRSLWTGAAVSLAILIRPNLAPVGAVFLWFLLARSPAGERWRTFFLFAAGGVPLGLLLAGANTRLYGAPWRSGYGTLEGFYAWSYVFKNLVQYPLWLLRTETPIVVLLFVPLVMSRRSESSRRATMLFLAMVVGAIWLSYLFYFPFDVWWYLRFLLPAFPVMLVLAATGLILVIKRIRRPEHAMAIAAVIVLIVFAVRIQTSRHEGIFALWRGGVSYLSGAEFIRTHLPENAVILTIQQSGSIRYYTGRLTLRWDWLDSAWWPRALDVLVERGYRPYLLVASYEEAQLRERFGLSTVVDAPGTVVATMELPEAFRIYDPLRESTGPPATITRVEPCPCGGFRASSAQPAATAVVIEP